MIRPPLLTTGDKIAIVSPSRMITEDQLKDAMQIIKSWGVDTSLGEHVFDSHGYFAGNDDNRLNDLQGALDDTKVKAIFCSRGGYGMSRIIDRINFDSFINNPKWLVGFSDITALHLKVNHLGIETIHGLMPVQFGYKGVRNSIESLRQLLFEGEMNYKLEVEGLNKLGKATGEMIGGNLSLIIDSLGTSTEIDTDGKILFIEEIDEYLYKIDRMLNQLKRAGKLKNIKGLVIGDFSQMKDTSIPFGMGIQELISDFLSDFEGPVAFGFPIGHETSNLSIPCGRTLTLEVTDKSVTLFD